MVVVAVAAAVVVVVGSSDGVRARNGSQMSRKVLIEGRSRKRKRRKRRIRERRGWLVLKVGSLLG